MPGTEGTRIGCLDLSPGRAISPPHPCQPTPPGRSAPASLATAGVPPAASRVTVTPRAAGDCAVPVPRASGPSPDPKTGSPDRRRRLQPGLLIRLTERGVSAVAPTRGATGRKSGPDPALKRSRPCPSLTVGRCSPLATGIRYRTGSKRPIRPCLGVSGSISAHSASVR